jgi:superfamily II DNA or RNA helicase
MQSDIATNNCDGIIAIQCLDEGVDIPEIEIAFILASSTNPKQFIQRRGRILRKAPNKDKAAIYDFVVTPPSYSEVSDMDKRLLSREMKRCIEFAELSENHFEARKSLDNIVDKYSLQHL